MFRKATGSLSAAVMALSLGAFAAEPVRIDGTTKETAETTFREMVNQAPADKCYELQVAALLIVFDGVGSAQEALSRPELRNPTIALVKDRVHGMTADELVALSKTSTSKAAPDEL